jgi:hypothetical protein
MYNKTIFYVERLNGRDHLVSCSLATMIGDESGETAELFRVQSCWAIDDPGISDAFLSENSALNYIEREELEEAQVVEAFRVDHRHSINDSWTYGDEAHETEEEAADEYLSYIVDWFDNHQNHDPLPQYWDSRKEAAKALLAEQNKIITDDDEVIDKPEEEDDRTDAEKVEDCLLYIAEISAENAQLKTALSKAENNCVAFDTTLKLADLKIALLEAEVRKLSGKSEIVYKYE